MSVEIELGAIYTYASGESGVRLGLEMLPADGAGHIHGSLRITINGRDLPYLGYFGPDDVCIGQWAHELSQLNRTLRDAKESRFVFDEGEQGQPAFVFRRRDSQVFVSLNASKLSGASADPEWQEVPCDVEDLLSSATRFLGELRSRLISLAPKAAEAWWRQHVAQG